ncbi:TPA: NEAT domain-containing protein [Streptococcus equi subsp. zooepidemicus]|nr:NEAT domain-containing protein [Streptococcus equi subsp. zooepidemicus]HEL0611436.1 NEAT domain-containing protein [Streptococcus equi subsp. zooepidemicus]HEL1344634.1 NEAT domain-containing protein [Streptococcus equi subsp. zooepidemicus]
MKSINKCAILALSTLALAQSAQTVRSEATQVSSSLVTTVKLKDNILLFEEIGPYADKSEGKLYYKNIEKILIDGKEYDKKLEGDYSYDINYQGIKVNAKDITEGRHQLFIVNKTNGGILVVFDKKGNDVTFVSAKPSDDTTASPQQATAKTEKPAKVTSYDGLAPLSFITKLEATEGELLFPEIDRYSSTKQIKELAHQITKIKVNDQDYKDLVYDSVKDKPGYVSDLKGLHLGTTAFKEGDNKIVISSQSFEDVIITVKKSGEQYTFVAAKQKQGQGSQQEAPQGLDFTKLESAIKEAERIIASEVNKEQVKDLSAKLQVIKESYRQIDNEKLLKETYELLMDSIKSYQGTDLAVTDLKAGTYTLTFKANKENTEESSMLQGAFDKKAKLVVKDDGKMEISLLNTALGQFLIDFSIESKGQYPTSVRTQVGERDINNNYIRSEFTLPIEELDKLHKGAVLVSAMGGQESDLHHYDKYTKLDMTFSATASKGWTGYQAEIDDKEKGVGSERLEKVLVKLGKDLNGDGKMSPEEIAKIEGELRLDHYDLTDISLLKHAKHITELHLEGNQIASIPKETFSQMTGLRFLNLRSNVLTTLDKDTFAHNSQLKELYLSSNYMPALEEGLFRNLGQLDQLDLSKNRISVIKDGAFNGLSGLTSLALAENIITDFSETALASLDNLNFFDVSENQLGSLPSSLSKLTKLSYIVANRNQILDIANIDFSHIPNLLTVDLASNELTKIPQGAFKANKQLSKLNVYNNLLTNISEADFADLKALDLDLKFNCLSGVSDKLRQLMGTNKLNPQKQLANLSAALNHQAITYHQGFSLLDLYYWEQQTLSSTEAEISSIEDYNKRLKASSSDVIALLNERYADWDIVVQLQKKTSTGQYVTVDERRLNNDPQDELQGSFDLKGAGVYRVRKALITKEFAKKREHIYLTSNDVEVKEDQLAGSGQSKGLDINKLEDGIYYIKASMLKNDLQSESMSHQAIDHRVKLIVNKGVYSLEVTFKGMKIGNLTGYLGELSYFVDGYQRDLTGRPVGKTEKAEVVSYFTDVTGKPLSDAYGSNYPQVLRFRLIDQAKKDGLVPLRVFVPIMDAISKGTGFQTVFMKLDLQSLTKDKAQLPHSEDNQGHGTIGELLQPHTGIIGGHTSPAIPNLTNLLAKKSAAPSSNAKEDAKTGTDKLKSLISSHKASKAGTGKTSKQAAKTRAKAKSKAAKHSQEQMKADHRGHIIIGLASFIVIAVGLILGRKKLF